MRPPVLILALDDDELLLAVSPPPSTQTNESLEVDPEPVQLPNGRWQCNHVCTAGGRTKTGKTCQHACCRDGLEKPRKPKPNQPRTLKRKVDQDDAEKAVAASASQSPTQPRPSTQTSPGRKKQRLDHATQRDSVSQSQLGSADDVRERHDEFSEIKFIDLCHMDSDEAESSPPSTRKLQGAAGEKTDPLDDYNDLWAGNAKTESSRLLPAKGNTALTPAAFNKTKLMGQIEDDYDSEIFDDLECMQLDQLMKASRTGSPRPFKAGASDQTLCAGMRETLDEPPQVSPMSPCSTKRAIDQATKLLDMHASSMSAGGQAGETAHAELRSDGVTGSVSLTSDDDGGEKGYVWERDSRDNLRDSILSPTYQDNGGKHTVADVVETEVAETMASKVGQNTNEPAWLGTCDPELVDFFRGYVNFV